MTDSPRSQPPFHTIGHSTRSVPELVQRLQAAGVTHLVDVRSIPRSRTNPQFNRDALPAALEPHGISYEYMADLGGLRSRQKHIAPEVNGFWRNRSFHNYADYALQTPFETALAALVQRGRVERCAVMCAEAVWWRCHRRIIADHLLARGETVCHIMDDRIVPASLTAGAQVQADGRVTYPAIPESPNASPTKSA